MEQKWKIRAYRDGDEEGIMELWRAVYSDRQFDGEKWLRLWQWMYKANPAGNGWIWLAEDKGRIVGQYAIVPVKMKVGTKIILAAQSVDTMTHPDYRRQKMFETLAQKVYEDAAADDVFLIYGFPNQFSHPGVINRLSWFDVSNMQIMLKSLNWRNAVKLRVRNRLLQIALAIGADLVFDELFWRAQKPPIIEGLNINQVTAFDERFDEFWNRICNQSQIMVVRNRDYLNWRYSTPDANYSIFTAEKDHRICGYIVLQHNIQEGMKISTVFDLMATPEEIMHCLISRAIEESRQKGIDIIIYSSITNKAYHRILRRNGFMSLPFKKGSYFTVYSSSSSISKEFLSNSQNWLVQTGDSDAI